MLINKYSLGTGSILLCQLLLRALYRMIRKTASLETGSSQVLFVSDITKMGGRSPNIFFEASIFLITKIGKGQHVNRKLEIMFIYEQRWV